MQNWIVVHIAKMEKHKIENGSNSIRSTIAYEETMFFPPFLFYKVTASMEMALREVDGSICRAQRIVNIHNKGKKNCIRGNSVAAEITSSWGD